MLESKASAPSESTINTKCGNNTVERRDYEDNTENVLPGLDVENGSVENGNVVHDSVKNEAAKNDIVENGNEENGSVKNGAETANNDAVVNGNVENDTVENGTFGNGSAENGTLGTGPAENGTFGNGSAENGTLGTGPAENGTFGNGSAENGTLGTDPAENGILENGSTDNQEVNGGLPDESNDYKDEQNVNGFSLTNSGNSNGGSSWTPQPHATPFIPQFLNATKGPNGSTVTLQSPKRPPRRFSPGSRECRGSIPVNNLAHPSSLHSPSHSPSESVAASPNGPQQHVVHLHVNPGETISIQMGAEMQLIQGNIFKLYYLYNTFKVNQCCRVTC